MDGIVYLPDPNGRGWRLFRSPVEILRAESVGEVRPALARLEKATERGGLHAAGLITYEASRAFGLDAHQYAPGGFPLLWFGLYEAFEQVADLPGG